MTVKHRLLQISGACLLAVCLDAAAQTPYPGKPVRWVVPYPPAGGADIVVRIIAQRLAASTGQPVVVENRAGAGGNVGSEMVAKAAPDGYTILLANVAPMAINVTLYAKLPYDPVRDFAPITLLASFPNVLVLHPSLPARSVTELVKLARARPGQLSYASAGSGSTTHLSAELFKTMGGLDMLHVPYRGGAQALTDLLGGQISMYFSALPGAMPHINNARLRALAVTSARRSVAAPEIPTMAESGFPGYEADTWIGVVAPAGTPRVAISRLHDEITRILSAAEVRERLLAQGAEPLTNTPEQFAAHIKSEIVKWAKVIKASGARAE
ncbi:MAG: tripartite tricarboxylate transporter substrate binding protein [Betaproteobacteria bacterium]|nr:tripartite tricarboxylate transporter substrate binding protein [Betaproteobacteria bacterium]